jgi:hypothetical protein
MDASVATIRDATLSSPLVEPCDAAAEVPALAMQQIVVRALNDLGDSDAGLAGMTLEHPSGVNIVFGAVPHVARMVAQNPERLAELIKVLLWAADPETPPQVVILRDGEFPIEVTAVDSIRR